MSVIATSARAINPNPPQKKYEKKLIELFLTIGGRSNQISFPFRKRFLIISKIMREKSL